MKKRLLYFSTVLFGLFIFRHWIFEKVVSYQPVSEQVAFPVSDTSLLHFLAAPKPERNIENIIRQATEMTARQLSFASQNTETDPNLSFHGRRAHCVGYAAFFATACNFLLSKKLLSEEKNSLGKDWKVKHVRGKTSLFGMDLHQFSDSPFFHDHDFNVVENLRTGERYLVDASVWDVLGLRFSKHEQPPELKN